MFNCACQLEEVADLERHWGRDELTAKPGVKSDPYAPLFVIASPMAVRQFNTVVTATSVLQQQHQKLDLINST